MKKRIFSMLLVVCMLFGMLPGFALPVSAGSFDITVKFTENDKRYHGGVETAFLRLLTILALPQEMSVPLRLLKVR